MAAPLGHALVGLAVAGPLAPAQGASRWAWYAFVAVAANAADLDFLAGLVMGDINRYHHGISHSLGAAVAVGALAAVVTGRWWPDRLRTALGVALAYASHILIDALTGEPWQRARGVCELPVLWPLSDVRMPLLWPVFHGIQHGKPGDSLWQFAESILLQPRHITALAKEFALTLPLAVASLYWAESRRAVHRHVPAAESVAANTGALMVEPDLA